MVRLESDFGISLLSPSTKPFWDAAVLGRKSMVRICIVLYLALQLSLYKVRQFAQDDEMQYQPGVQSKRQCRRAVMVNLSSMHPSLVMQP